MSNPITELSRVSAIPAATPARGESLRASAFVAPPAAAGNADPSALADAVGRLNQHFADKRSDLKFSIDPQLHEVVVSVVDTQDGTVLQQIPSEVALRIARYLQETSSGLVEARA